MDFRDSQVHRIIENQQHAGLRKIGEKILNKERILFDEGVIAIFGPGTIIADAAIKLLEMLSARR